MVIKLHNIRNAKAIFVGVNYWAESVDFSPLIRNTDEVWEQKSKYVIASTQTWK